MGTISSLEAGLLLASGAEGAGAAGVVCVGGVVFAGVSPFVRSTSSLPPSIILPAKPAAPTASPAIRPIGDFKNFNRPGSNPRSFGMNLKVIPTIDFSNPPSPVPNSNTAVTIVGHQSLKNLIRLSSFF